MSWKIKGVVVRVVEQEEENHTLHITQQHPPAFSSQALDTITRFSWTWTPAVHDHVKPASPTHNLCLYSVRSEKQLIFHSKKTANKWFRFSWVGFMSVASERGGVSFHFSCDALVFLHMERRIKLCISVLEYEQHLSKWKQLGTECELNWRRNYTHKLPSHRSCEGRCNRRTHACTGR